MSALVGTDGRWQIGFSGTACDAPTARAAVERLHALVAGARPAPDREGEEVARCASCLMAARSETLGHPWCGFASCVGDLRAKAAAPSPEPAKGGV